MTDPEPPDPLACPVCKERFDNEQGRGGHLAVSKDAEHEAYRSLGHLPLAEATSPASPPALAAGSPTSTSPASEPQPEPELEPRSLQPSLEPRQQEDQATSEVLEASFELPDLIQPLLPPQTEPGATSTPSKPQAVVVPLEPILAGATAAALNGLFLAGEGDGQLTPATVGATGFPKAAEACLRFYFPDLALDHPLTALIVSGASLGLLVASLKAKPAAEAKPTATPPDAPAPAPPAPAPAKGTGDPYWDAILAKAGGVVQ